MLTQNDIEALDWGKNAGLIPAVIEDAVSGRVLMLAYMNRESLQKTLETKRVTFFSRSKGRLWTKGETSGNFLNLVDLAADCDKDTLLVTVNAEGPACHLGTTSCFGDLQSRWQFLRDLEVLLASRKGSRHVLHREPLRPRHEAHCSEGGRRRCGNGARGDGARPGRIEKRSGGLGVSPSRSPAGGKPGISGRHRHSARTSRGARSESGSGEITMMRAGVLGFRQPARGFRDLRSRSLPGGPSKGSPG